ncbi:MAG: HAMP domain-containing methyl-accepting chemotaxis protein [Planctomycetes bacterium]|nr:HAMP domain-containing methyl-accepting chemotaxis protein [Planctomycetota bacterium]
MSNRMNGVYGLLRRHGFSMQTKLIVIFLIVKVIPLFILTFIAWHQFVVLGTTLREIAVLDSTTSLNDSAVKNIERMSTDTARAVADFLYERDDDIRYVATLPRDQAAYAAFVNGARRRLIKQGRWELAPDRQSWVDTEVQPNDPPGVSTNRENEDMDGFHAIPISTFEYINAPLYDEIAFFDLEGNEQVKYVPPDSTKRRHRPDPTLKNVSRRENTFVKAETYWDKLSSLRPGEIYVSDVTGAYVGSNYIGMYVPDAVRDAAAARGYPIEYKPEEQAYSGKENPNGRRFEGIVRFITPVADENGRKIGYASLALNHDHIMEFVDHITPMDERYTELPSAYEGNYAFIWDYQCRSICHPRHHSIFGADPNTGDPQVPWLEESIYQGWKRSGVAKWFDYVKDIPTFHEQSRSKRPAPELTRAGLIGLDGRYLNNAPQCTGWMDLTKNGGSGSFYILWSGLYKLNTAAAIPYYTGQYAPSAANGHSRRGFGFVAIGSGLDYFTAPARATEAKLVQSIDENLTKTVMQLIVTTIILTGIVILIAIWMAWHISSPIRRMAGQMTRLAQGDFINAEVATTDQGRYDEIGLLARSLHDLVQARRDEFSMANDIAKGDYTRTIRLRSDMDLLGKALNAMVKINKEALTQVNYAVRQVGDGASAVSDVSVSLSQGVETSENVLREIAETIETVNRQAQENAGHAQGANALATDSQDAAHRGYDAVVELSSAMSQIEAAGKQIASVVKLIDDIAFQTNLLALNAAVEASRAGRNGKGFSVVADEVRNLASRSAKAAHETGTMVASMLDLMGTGTKLAAKTDQEFRQIVDTTSKVATLFRSIAEASEEQSSAISLIVTSLNRIDEVTKENSVNSEQMAVSAGDLSKQAEELRHMVSHFRLGIDDGRRDRRLPGGDQSNW